MRRCTQEASAVLVTFCFLNCLVGLKMTVLLPLTLHVCKYFIAKVHVSHKIFIYSKLPFRVFG